MNKVRDYLRLNFDGFFDLKKSFLSGHENKKHHTVALIAKRYSAEE